MKSIHSKILKLILLFSTVLLISISAAKVKETNLSKMTLNDKLNKNSMLISDFKADSIPLFQPDGNNCPKIIEEAKFDLSFPKRRKDRFTPLNLNQGPIAYLIDFIEDGFKNQNKLIQSMFKSIFEDAKSQTAPENYKDPYSLLKMATGNPMSTETLANDELYQKWLVKDNKFNKDVYENSLTVGQILTVLRNWRWAVNMVDAANEAKALVDEFDFNGDGRLNMREFVIAMIMKTKELVPARICTRCLEDIILDIIDPIFTYLDCKRKNIINAEEMWKGLKFLNRKNPKSYDIYTCKIREERYRTSAVNDFVLKAYRKTLGYISRKEFRMALLIAFWDRYTTPMGIDEEGENKRRQKRWGDNGEKDNICERIIELYNQKTS